MLPPATLFRYISFAYLKSYATALLIVVFGLIISNSFDIINRYRSIDLSSDKFLQLISLKVPYLVAELSFFIGFIATLYFFRKLKRNQEFVALLASGLSVIRIVAVIAVIQFSLGVIFTLLFGHVAPAMLNRMDRLEAVISANNNSNAVQSFIFNKQIIAREESENGAIIYKLSHINTQSKILGNVEVVFVGSNHRFAGAYFADSAVLTNDKLVMQRALYQGIDGQSKVVHDIEISTSLTVDNFTESLYEPENISFWRLGNKIKNLEKLGMPIANYQAYYAKLIVRPLSLMVWAIIAACFVIGYDNRVAQDKLKQTLFPLLLGAVLYTFSESSSKMLMQMAITPYYAALIPQLLLLFTSIFAILHLHEE